MNSQNQPSSRVSGAPARILLPATVLAIIATVWMLVSKNSSSPSWSSHDSVTQLFKQLASEQEWLIPSILFFKEQRQKIEACIKKFISENATTQKTDEELTKELTTILQSEFPVTKQHPHCFTLSFKSIYEIGLDIPITRHMSVDFGTRQYLLADDSNHDHQGDGYEDIHVTSPVATPDDIALKPGEALFRHYAKVQTYLDENIDRIESTIRRSTKQWDDMSQIDFISSLVELFPGDNTLQGYMIGDFTIQREIIKDEKWERKIRIYFSVPYRNDDPHVIEIILPKIIQA